MYIEVGQRGVLQKVTPLTPLGSPPTRFLRASKWNATECIKKLGAALKWRREYGIYDTLTLESIKEHVRILVAHYIGDKYNLNCACLRYLQVSKREGVYIWI